jgi:hypothetical protein
MGLRLLATIGLLVVGMWWALPCPRASATLCSSGCSSGGEEIRCGSIAMHLGAGTARQCVGGHSHLVILCSG